MTKFVVPSSILVPLLIIYSIIKNIKLSPIIITSLPFILGIETLVVILLYNIELFIYYHFNFYARHRRRDRLSRATLVVCNIIIIY